MFGQPGRVVARQSHAMEWEGGVLLPSSEMEDREEKADHSTVVVPGCRLELELEIQVQIQGSIKLYAVFYHK